MATTSPRLKLSSARRADWVMIKELAQLHHKHGRKTDFDLVALKHEMSADLRACVQDFETCKDFRNNWIDIMICPPSRATFRLLKETRKKKSRASMPDHKKAAITVQGQPSLDVSVDEIMNDDATDKSQETATQPMQVPLLSLWRKGDVEPLHELATLSVSVSASETSNLDFTVIKERACPRLRRLIESKEHYPMFNAHWKRYLVSPGWLAHFESLRESAAAKLQQGIPTETIMSPFRPSPVDESYDDKDCDAFATPAGEQEIPETSLDSTTLEHNENDTPFAKKYKLTRRVHQNALLTKDNPTDVSLMKELACLLVRSNKCPPDFEFVKKFASPQLRKYVNIKQKNRPSFPPTWKYSLVSCKSTSYFNALLSAAGWDSILSIHGKTHVPTTGKANLTRAGQQTANAASVSPNMKLCEPVTQRIRQRHYVTKRGKTIYLKKDDPTQKLLMHELAMLVAKSRKGGGNVDFEFVKQFASQQLRNCIQERQNKRTSFAATWKRSLVDVNSITYFNSLVAAAGSVHPGQGGRNKEILKVEQSNVNKDDESTTALSNSILKSPGRGRRKLSILIAADLVMLRELARFCGKDEMKIDFDYIKSRVSSELKALIESKQKLITFNNFPFKSLVTDTSLLYFDALRKDPGMDLPSLLKLDLPSDGKKLMNLPRLQQQSRNNGSVLSNPTLPVNSPCSRKLSRQNQNDIEDMKELAHLVEESKNPNVDFKWIKERASARLLELIEWKELVHSSRFDSAWMGYLINAKDWSYFRTLQEASSNSRKGLANAESLLQVETSKRKKSSALEASKKRKMAQVNSVKQYHGIGDVVFACFTLDENSPSSDWMLAVVIDFHIKGKSKRGEIRTYDLVFEDSDIYEDVPEIFVKIVEDYEWQRDNDVTDMKGCRFFLDHRSKDDYFRLRGWFEVPSLPGRIFTSASDAMRAHDANFVAQRGKHTQPSDLNFPQEWIFSVDEEGSDEGCEEVDDETLHHASARIDSSDGTDSASGSAKYNEGTSQVAGTAASTPEERTDRISTPDDRYCNPAANVEFQCVITTDSGRAGLGNRDVSRLPLSRYKGILSQYQLYRGERWEDLLNRIRKEQTGMMKREREGADQILILRQHQRWRSFLKTEQTVHEQHLTEIRNFWKSDEPKDVIGRFILQNVVAKVERHETRRREQWNLFADGLERETVGFGQLAWEVQLVEWEIFLADCLDRWTFFSRAEAAMLECHLESIEKDLE